MRTTITRWINGKAVPVTLQDATTPLVKSDADRLKEYRGERSEALEDKLENPVIPVVKEQK